MKLLIVSLFVIGCYSSMVAAAPADDQGKVCSSENNQACDAKCKNDYPQHVDVAGRCEISTATEVHCDCLGAQFTSENGKQRRFMGSVGKLVFANVLAGFAQNAIG